MPVIIVIQRYYNGAERREFSGTVMDSLIGGRGNSKWPWPLYTGTLKEARILCTAYFDDYSPLGFAEREVLTVEKWDVKSNRDNLLNALCDGITMYESAFPLECWTRGDNGELISWKGENRKLIPTVVGGEDAT